jgi:hypothetical protein
MDLDVETQQQQLAGAEFAALIAPLEQRVGRALKEPGRTECARAFAENAGAFARLAEDALTRGRNPLALLVKMVREGDHRVVPPASLADRRSFTNVTERHRGPGHCFVCERWCDDALFKAGQYWCVDHEGQAAA